MQTLAPYYKYKAYLTDNYGYPLFRIPIDLGWGCPNRTPDGSGGCSFCPGDGAHSVQTPAGLDLSAQIETGVGFARERYHAMHFMAYVQTYTGTHAAVESQQITYQRILDTFDFEALCIGTRPDCLPTGTLDLLTRLRQKADIIVELGIQTFHDPTLLRINRGHDAACSIEAVHKLAQRGIRVMAHVILGLPGESDAQMRATAETLAALPIDGVKIHNLHVIRGTALATEYVQKPFPVPDEAEYADLLIDFIRRLPPHMAIMRINTDTESHRLIAPRWQMKKGRFMHMVEERMRRQGLRQGDLCRPGAREMAYIRT